MFLAKGHNMTARFFILWLCTISTTIMASACQNASEATSAPLDSAPFDETPSATLSVEEGPIEIKKPSLSHLMAPWMGKLSRCHPPT
jgi:hypothetical protein